MEAVHSVDPGRNGSVSFQRNSGKKKLFILVEKKTFLSLIVVSFSTQISKIYVAMYVALYLAIYVAMI